MSSFALDLLIYCLREIPSCVVLLFGSYLHTGSYE